MELIQNAWVPGTSDSADAFDQQTNTHFSLVMILINRLVLNLKHEKSAPSNDTTISFSPAFAVNSILGNIGAPLDYSTEDMDFANDERASEVGDEWEENVIPTSEFNSRLPWCFSVPLLPNIKSILYLGLILLADAADPAPNAKL